MLTRGFASSGRPRGRPRNPRVFLILEVPRILPPRLKEPKRVANVKHRQREKSDTSIEPIYKHINRVQHRTIMTYQYLIDDIFRRDAEARRDYADIAHYPRDGFNTLVNVCPQDSVMIVETLGKFTRVQHPGVFIAAPLVQKIRAVIDTREMMLETDKHSVYTRDGHTLNMSAQIYICITDPIKACYAIKRPLIAVMACAISRMRISAGMYNLDKLVKERWLVADDMRYALTEYGRDWGIAITRLEITELVPSPESLRILAEQNMADRALQREEKIAAQKRNLTESEVKQRASALLIEIEAQIEALKRMDASGVKPEELLCWRKDKHKYPEHFD